MKLTGIHNNILRTVLLLVFLCSSGFINPGQALAGMDPFVGEIEIFAGNFAPTGYAFCNGQILPISQNTALFSLLGATYGGMV